MHSIVTIRFALQKSCKTLLFHFFLTLFILAINSSEGVFAQNLQAMENKDLSQINLDDYTKEDLQALFEQAERYGMDDEKLYQLLKSKGIQDTELEKLKEQRKLMDLKKDDTKDNVVVPSKKEKQPLKDLSAMMETTYDKTIYGSELFSKSSTVFEPNIRIATPSSYVLGPDDELFINVYGYSEKQYTLEVNKEGKIYIPGVGPLEVSGLSMEQATQKIKNKLASTIYTAIRSGATQLQVSLGKIKSIQVTVIGEVKKPGTYTVSSLTTLFNVLYMCGGPSDLGSYRNIEIVRGNAVARKADMYQFLSKGDRSDDILLQERDVIRVPYCDSRVKITGQVRRPGKYEFSKDDTYESLMQYCGGLEENAYKGTISVFRIEDRNRTVLDIEKDSMSVRYPKSGDEIFVNKMPSIYANKVTVKGSVFAPGNYELTPQTTLRKLIEKSGGLLPDSYSKRVTIFRQFENKLPTTVAYNLDSLKNANADVQLVKDDSIWVHSIFDFIDDATVSVEGYVRNPGIYPWRDNLTLRDLLSKVGGINESGDSTNIEISRRNKNVDVRSSKNIESEIILFGIASDSSAADFILKPFDVVVIKKKPGVVNQRMVVVDGEVVVPGKYILKSSNDKILDVIKRAGGFRASADSNFATIRRLNKSSFSKEEKQSMFKRLLNLNNDTIEKNKKVINEISKTYDLISVNLSNIIRSGGEASSDNLMLEDGDILVVTKKTNIVKVSGEVYYPNIIALRKNKNAKYYIKQAGNFMPAAQKDKTIVVYPNGKTKSVKRFLFLKKYPKVVSGSEIFVPQKNNKSKKGLSIAEWSVLVSSLAIIGNLIINLKKN